MIDQKYLEETFKSLHKIPELGLREFKTSEFIANELRILNLQVQYGVGGTGVIGTLDSGNEGPIICLRADMDALEYKIDGNVFCAHTCGHDAHTTMVLGAAKALSRKGISRGKVLFLFQPAEELGVGAINIIKTGAIDHITEMIGIHLRPVNDTQLGEATPEVIFNAGAKFNVSIQGIMSHGAWPHLGVNAIEAAVLSINSVNALKFNPLVSHSIKVTKISCMNESHNTIPERVELVFDIRSRTNELMEEILTKTQKAIEFSCESIDAIAICSVEMRLDAPKYDATLVESAALAIKEVLGSVKSSVNAPGCEDFSFYTTMLPIKAAYIGLGCNLEPGLHHIDMKFDLKALKYGTDILLKIVDLRLS